MVHCFLTCVARCSGRRLRLLGLTALLRLDALLRHRCGLQELVALVALLQDMAVVRQPVEQSRRHLRFAEHPNVLRMLSGRHREAPRGVHAGWTA